MNSKRERTQQKLWEVGERLFMERGLTGVTLQDIAAAIEMRHASLYYYIPEGKEQLYVQVMERVFRAHYAGLTASIEHAGDDFRAQIHAVAIWFAHHTPLDLGRITRSDLPLLKPSDASHIVDSSLAYLRRPIADVLYRAVEKGLITLPDVEFAAMGFIALVQSVHNIPTQFIESPEHLDRIAISNADMLLDGWFNR